MSFAYNLIGTPVPRDYTSYIFRTRIYEYFLLYSKSIKMLELRLEYVDYMFGTYDINNTCGYIKLLSKPII